MSMAITHFAAGGVFTTLVLIYFVPTTAYSRSLVLLGGIWGMVPDAHWVSPVFTTELRALHDSDLVNVFWLHRTLDVVDPADSKALAALALAAFFVAGLVADRWSYATREQARGSAESPLDAVRSVTVLGRVAGLAGVATGLGYCYLGVFHPEVGALRGSYLGVGAILLVAGLFGLTAAVEAEPWVTRWIPWPVLLAAWVPLCVGGLTTGLTLVATPVRAGIGASSVLVTGFGCVLLLQTVLFAQIAGRWGTVRPRAEAGSDP